MCHNYFFLQQTFSLIEFPYSLRSCNQKKTWSLKLLYGRYSFIRIKLWANELNFEQKLLPISFLLIHSFEIAFVRKTCVSICVRGCVCVSRPLAYLPPRSTRCQFLIISCRCKAVKSVKHHSHKLLYTI